MIIKRPFLFIALCALTALPLSHVHAKDTQKPAAQETEKAREKIFNAKTHTLDNGLQIVVVENHRAPVVTHMLWYRVGSADEPRGKSGIAHFLEHLLFKGHSYPGLGTYEPGEFSRIVRALGGEDNAFTSQDYTAYYQSIAKEHLERMMTIEAARMRGLNAPEEEIQSENKVIQEERRQRTDTKPYAQLYEQLNEALFPNSLYGIPVIGWMHEIQGLTSKDIMDFYRTFYAPNNAILVVSGDVKAEDVFDMALHTYGILPPSEIPTRNRIESPSFIAQTEITLSHETVQEPVMTRMYRVPSYRQNETDSLALQVLEEIMGGGSTSRLYKSLVVEQKLATNVSFSYMGISWDDAKVTISANMTAPDKIDAVKNAIDEELKLLIKDGLSDAELSDALTRLQAEAIYARDSLSGPAMIIGYNMITGSSLDDIEYWPYKIAQVTKEQIQAVAKTYLNPDQPTTTPPVTGLLLPKPATEQSQGDVE